MKYLAIFIAALLLPFGAAQPQAFSYATSNRIIASGFVDIGFGNGFTGVKQGSSSCNAFNDTFGTYTASTLNSRLMFGVGVPCMISLSGTYDLLVVLGFGASAGSAASQNYFSYIRVVDCTGATRIYTSSTATYTAGTGPNYYYSWRWGTGSNVLFNGSSCPGAPLLMTFFR